MKSLLLAGAFLCMTALSLRAQKPVTTIQQLTDSIQTIMQEEHITGLMLGITTKDSVLFAGGLGYADLDNRRQVDAHTLFRMGSITKMFVSLGILQLIHEGKLTLNTELKQIAPEVPFQNPWEATHPIRIIHLLEHTTGFDDIKLNRLYTFHSKKLTGIDNVLMHQSSLQCRWQPGERFAYSNPNYVILGYLIEKLTGKPYDQYLKETILDPLGMHDSNFNLSSQWPDKEVKEYVVRGGKTIPVGTVSLLNGPQGALWSNAADMVQFVQLFLRYGSPLYDTAAIKEMETPHSSLAARAGQKNGYALANDNMAFPWAKFPFSGHDGLTGTCFSSFRYNHELGVGFVLSSNSNNNNYRILQLIVDYLTQNAPDKPLHSVPVNMIDILPYTGRYQFESPRMEISAFSDKLTNAPEVLVKDNKLYFKPLMVDAQELIQTAPFTFALKGMNGALIRFVTKEDGQRVMLVGGSYFEQTSNAWALTKRLFIVVALLLAVSAVVAALIAFIVALAGKLSWKEVLWQLVPVLGMMALVIASKQMLELQTYSYTLSKMATVNDSTLAIFIGTTLFAIASVVSLCYAIIRWRRPGKRWYKVYLLACGLALCFITMMLWQYGWIGLRPWAL